MTLLVSRREQLQTIVVRLGSSPEPAWNIEVDPQATPGQQAPLAAWLEPAARQF